MWVQLTEIGLASANHNQQTVPGSGGRGTRSFKSWLFLLLAFAVFAWGTSYKLSLYKTTRPDGVTPAKLCKLTSDNAKIQVDHAIEGHKVTFFGSSFYKLPESTTLLLVLQGEVRPPSAAASLSPLQAAPILHLRPPPALDPSMFL